MSTDLTNEQLEALLKISEELTTDDFLRINEMKYGKDNNSQTSA